MTTPTRFDLEQEILDCWRVVDDLKVVLAISEAQDWDRVQNAILGMRELYEHRFDHLFKTFTECIKNNQV
jgi:hypothetical protein